MKRVKKKKRKQLQKSKREMIRNPSGILPSFLGQLQTAAPRTYPSSTKILRALAALVI